MSRLLIIQPYVPTYRVPFFRRLRAELSRSDIELRLVAGRPQGNAALRGDEAPAEEVDAYVDQRVYSVAGKSLNFRSVHEEMRRYPPDLIVVEQAVKNLEAYALLLRSTTGRGARVGMWGQGRSFSTTQGTTAGALKDWLTRRSDWFFAYTQEGADHVCGRGYDRGRVSVLNNTFDTGDLLSNLQNVDASDLESFRREHGLTAGQTALFMGGVDSDKGINFLLASAKLVRQEMPGFTLLVAGAGRSADLVRRMQLEGEPVVYLGRVDGVAKALSLQAADVMMIPQWVGLVAVDSLASGRPIITTRHPSHSPEFGYLIDGRNAFVSEHREAAYASTVVSVLQDPDRLAKVQEQARHDSEQYSLPAMVDRFVGGVRSWIEAR